MTEFFYFIEYLFVEFLFLPFNFLRSLELESWVLANSINFLFIITVVCALSYWTLQLIGVSKRGEENEDPSAHSFL